MVHRFSVALILLVAVLVPPVQTALPPTALQLKVLYPAAHDKSYTYT